MVQVKLGQLHGELPVFLLVTLAVQGLHLQGLGLGRADFVAVAAAGAVKGADLNAEAVAGIFLAQGLLGLKALGLLGAVGHQEGADDRMGAHHGALVALDAVLNLPLGHVHGDAALLILGGGSGHNACRIKGGHGERIPGLAQDGLDHGVKVISGGQLHGRSTGGGVCPLGRNLHLFKPADGDVNGGPVGLDHLVALAAIGLLGVVLHVFFGFFVGDHIGQLEEGRLHDGVDAPAHAHLLGQVDGVDGVELGLLLGQGPLHGGGEALFQLFLIPGAVEQEGAALLEGRDHVIGRHIGGVMAGDEVGIVNLVGGLDGALAKAQVGYGEAARLLGVIGEIGLHVQVGVVTDDLDGVLVGAHGAVRAQAVELAGDGALGRGVVLLAQVQGGVGHVIHDAHGEVVLGLGLFHVLIDGLDHGGGEFLAGQAIAPAVDGDVMLAGLNQRRAHVGVQRVAQGAGLLGAVHDREALDGFGERCQQPVRREGAVQADFQHAVFLAFLVQGRDGLVHGLAA